MYLKKINIFSPLLFIQSTDIHTMLIVRSFFFLQFLIYTLYWYSSVDFFLLATVFIESRSVFFLCVCVCKFRTNITVRLIRTIIILCCVLWCDLVFSIVEFFLLYFLFFFFFEYALYRLIDKNKQNRNRIFFSRYGKIKLRYLTVSYFHACILLPYASKINNDALIEIWMRKEVHINQIWRCFFSEIA